MSKQFEDLSSPGDVKESAIQARRVRLHNYYKILNDVASGKEQPTRTYTAGAALTKMAGNIKEQQEDAEVEATTQVATPRPTEMLPPPVEEEPPPLADKSLLDRPAAEIQQELSDVIEPSDTGGFKWYPEALALAEQKDLDLTKAPAILSSIIQARSGGDENYRYGDASGLFAMGYNEKKYVEQQLKQYGWLPEEITWSAEDYDAWRHDPELTAEGITQGAENQLLFYSPIIYSFVIRGMEAGYTGRDLAEYVGQESELPGARQMADGEYAKAYDTITSIAQQAINEVYPDGVPESVRVKAGIVSPEDIERAGMRTATGDDYAEWEEEYDVTYREVTTTEGKAFEAGKPKEWYDKYFIDHINNMFLPVKQWAGMMYHTSPASRSMLITGAKTVDRIASVIGGAASAITATVLPVYAIGAFLGKDTSSSDSIWQSLGMKAHAAYDMTRSRIQRTGEIFEPSYPTEEAMSLSDWWDSIRREDYYDHVTDDELALTPGVKDTRWKPQGFTDFKRIFVPGAAHLDEEELSKAWDGPARDFSYTWLYNPKAEQGYLRDKDYVLAQINKARAMDGLEPRDLHYHEKDRLKKHWEDPDTEMVGEMFGDWTWLFPTWAVKGVLRWATAGKVWRGLKAGVMEVPLAKYLLTEAVKSQAPKVKGRAITPLEDIYYAFQKMLQSDGDDLGKFIKEQADDSNTGGLVEALQVYLQRGTIQDLDGKTIDLVENTFRNVEEAMEQGAQRAEISDRWRVWLGVTPPELQGEGIWRRVLKKEIRSPANITDRRGSRHRILGESVERRIAGLFKIFEHNQIWKQADGGIQEGFLDDLRRIGQQFADDDAFKVLSPEEKGRAVLQEFQKHIEIEFNMKHGIPQKGRIYSMGDEGEMVVTAAKEINPLTMAGPNYLRRLWIESNLSARPGFTIRNVFDSMFRALVVGGHTIFYKSLQEIIDNIPIAHGLVEGFAARELGAGALSIMTKKRLPKPWKLGDWVDAFRDVTIAAEKAGDKGGSAMSRMPWPIGRREEILGIPVPWKGTVRTKKGPYNWSLATAMEVARDWNEAFEVMLRLRLYDKFYNKNYKNMFDWYAKEVVRRQKNPTVKGIIKNLLGQNPKSEDQILDMLNHFLVENNLHRDLMVPEAVHKLVNAATEIKTWDPQKAARIIDEVIKDIWAAHEEILARGGRQLTPDTIKQVIQKNIKKQKDNLEKEIENIKKGGGGTTGPHGGTGGGHPRGDIDGGPKTGGNSPEPDLPPRTDVEGDISAEASATKNTDPVEAPYKDQAEHEKILKGEEFVGREDLDATILSNQHTASGLPKPVADARKAFQSGVGRFADISGIKRIWEHKTRKTKLRQLFNKTINFTHWLRTHPTVDDAIVRLASEGDKSSLLGPQLRTPHPKKKGVYLRGSNKAWARYNALEIKINNIVREAIDEMYDEAKKHLDDGNGGALRQALNKIDERLDQLIDESGFNPHAFLDLVVGKGNYNVVPDTQVTRQKNLVGTIDYLKVEVPVQITDDLAEQLRPETFSMVWGKEGGLSGDELNEFIKTYGKQADLPSLLRLTDGHTGMNLKGISPNRKTGEVGKPLTSKATSRTDIRSEAINKAENTAKGQPVGDVSVEDARATANNQPPVKVKEVNLEDLDDSLLQERIDDLAKFQKHLGKLDSQDQQWLDEALYEKGKRKAIEAETFKIQLRSDQLGRLQKLHESISAFENVAREISVLEADQALRFAKNPAEAFKSDVAWKIDFEQFNANPYSNQLSLANTQLTATPEVKSRYLKLLDDIVKPIQDREYLTTDAVDKLKLTRPVLDEVQRILGIADAGSKFVYKENKDVVKSIGQQLELEAIISDANNTYGANVVSRWGKDEKWPAEAEEIIEKIVEIFDNQFGKGMEKERKVSTILDNFQDTRNKMLMYRKFKLYTDGIAEALVMKKPVPEDVLLNALEIEEQLHRQFKVNSGLSWQYTSKNKQHVVVREALEDLNLDPQDYVSLQKQILEGWEVHKTDDVVEVFLSPKSVKARISELMVDPDQPLMLYGYSRLVGYDKKAFQIVKRNVSDLQPYEMPEPEFFFWYQTNQHDAEKLVSYGADVLSQTRFGNAGKDFSYIVSRPESMKSMEFLQNESVDMQNLWTTIRNERKKVLLKAIDDNNHVPFGNLQDFGEELFNYKAEKLHRGKFALEEVYVKSPQGGRMSYKAPGDTQRTRIKIRTAEDIKRHLEFALGVEPGLGPKKYKDIPDGWDISEIPVRTIVTGKKTKTKAKIPVIEAEIAKRTRAIVEGRMEVVVGDVPKPLMILNQIPIDAINFETNVEVLKEIRTYITHIRGRNVGYASKLMRYADEANTTALRYTGDIKKAYHEVATMWQNEERNARWLQSILDDRIAGMQPGWRGRFTEEQWKQNIAREKLQSKSLLVPDEKDSTIKHNLDEYEPKLTKNDLDGKLTTDTREIIPAYAQVEQILLHLKDKALAAGASYEDKYTYAAAEFLAGSRFRVGEAANLQWKHLLNAGEEGDFRKFNSVYMKTYKGKAASISKMTEEAKQALDLLLKHIQTDSKNKYYRSATTDLDEFGKKYVFHKPDFSKGKPGERINNLRKVISNSGKEDTWGLTRELLEENEKIINSRIPDLLWQEGQTLVPHDLRKHVAVKIYDLTLGDIESVRTFLGHENKHVTILNYLQKGGVTDDKLSIGIASSEYMAPSLGDDLDVIHSVSKTNDYTQKVVNRILSLKPIRNIIDATGEVNKVYQERYDSIISELVKARKKKATADWYEKDGVRTQVGEFLKPIEADQTQHGKLLAQTARRSKGGSEDVAVYKKIVNIMVDRLAAEQAIDRNITAQRVFDTVITELADDVPRTKPNYTELAKTLPSNLPGHSAYVLQDSVGNTWAHSPVYLSSADAERGLSFFRTRGFDLRGATKIEGELANISAQKFGDDYVNWRRWKMSSSQELKKQIANNSFDQNVSWGKKYAEAVDNFNAWHQHSVAAHKAGLEAFHPLIDNEAPLSYATYLREQYQRGIHVVDAISLRPQRLEIDQKLYDNISDKHQHIVRTREKVQKNQNITTKGKRHSIATINKKEYILTGPEDAWRIVPEEEWLNEKVLAMPEGYTSVIDTNLDIANVTANPKDKFQGTISFPSLEKANDFDIRNHEITHIYLLNHYDPKVSGNKISDSPFLSKYAKIKNLQGEGDDYFTTVLENATNDVKDFILARDTYQDVELKKLFEDHFPKSLIKMGDTNIKPRKFTPGRAQLNYNGVKVDVDNKTYVMTDNIHLYPPDSVVAKVKISEWKVEPLWGEDVFIEFNNQYAKAKFGVVEADDLLTTHIIKDKAVVRNPDAPDWFTGEQLENYDEAYNSLYFRAQTLTPELSMLRSDNALEAGVLITPNGYVIDGNGSVLSYRMTYDEAEAWGRDKLYKKQLKDRLGDFGLENEIYQIDDFEKPILVRILDTEPNSYEVLRMQEAVNRTIYTIDPHNEKIIGSILQDAQNLRKSTDKILPQEENIPFFPPKDVAGGDTTSVVQQVYEGKHIKGFVHEQYHIADKPEFGASADDIARITRAAMIDLINPKADEASEVVKQALDASEIYLRAPIKEIENLVQQFLDRYVGIKNIANQNAKGGLEGFNIADTVYDAISFIYEARMQYPHLAIREGLDKLHPASGAPFTNLNWGTEKYEPAQRLAIFVTEVVDSPDSIGGMLDKYIDVAKDLVDEDIVNTNKLEILKNAIRENIPESKDLAGAKKIIEEGGVLARSSIDDILEKTGPSFVDTPETFELELAYQAAGLGFIADWLRMEKDEIAQKTIASFKQAPNVESQREVVRGLNRDKWAAQIPSWDAMAEDAKEGVLEWIAKILNDTQYNDPLFREGKQEFGVLKWTPEQLYERKDEILERLTNYIARRTEALKRSPTDDHLLALSVVKEKAPQVLREIITHPNQIEDKMHYQTLAELITALENEMITGGGINLNPFRYAQYSEGGNRLILNAEGKELFQDTLLLLRDESFRLDKYNLPSVRELKDVEIEVLARQASDLAQLRMNADAWSNLYSGQTVDETVRAPVTKSLHLGSGPLPVGEKVRNQEAQAQYIQSALHEIIDTAGSIGLHQLNDIVRMAGSLMLGKPQELYHQKGLLGKTANWFHYAHVLDNYPLANITRKKLRDLTQEEVMRHTKYLYSDAEKALKAVNRLIQRGSVDFKNGMEKVLGDTGLDLAIYGKGRFVPQYTLDDEIPVKFLHALREVDHIGQYTPEAAASWYTKKGLGLPDDLVPDEFQKEIKLGNFTNTNDPNFGTHDAQTAAINAVRQEAHYMEQILREWEGILLGPEKEGTGGLLNHIVELPDGTLKELIDEITGFSGEKPGIKHELRALKNTAMYGTTDEVFAPKVVRAPHAASKMEDVADTWFNEKIKKFHEDGYDIYNIDHFDQHYGMNSKDFEKQVKAIETAPVWQSEEEAIRAVEEFKARVAVQREAFEQVPMMGRNWSTMQKSLVAREGLGDLRQMSDQLTPEDLNQLAPGYYQQVSNLPIVRDFQGLWKGETKTHPIRGAVDLVGDAMVDYSTNTNLDIMMKNVFPFWIFPTRSLRFWAGELAARPKILSTWAAIQT